MKQSPWKNASSWDRQARKIYPPSEFANDGISRLVKKVLPES